MIDLYTWSTPNGRKVSIMLEELALPYRVFPIDIVRGDQFEDEFLRISPNNKIPAIVDQDNDMTLMESGAILLYLAEQSGRFMATEASRRWQVIEWLMWQMGGIGPMLGQAHHFIHFNPTVSEYARQRYAEEAQRLYGVLDRRLSEHEYLADDYSIADIATWPWISRFEWQGVDLAHYPHVKRWYLAIAERPAVQRGYRVPNSEFTVPLP